MPAGDTRRAVRYLLVGVVAYALLAVGTGHGIQAVDLVVLGAGIVALVLVASRLTD